MKFCVNCGKLTPDYDGRRKFCTEMCRLKHAKQMRKLKDFETPKKITLEKLFDLFCEGVKQELIRVNSCTMQN